MRDIGPLSGQVERSMSVPPEVPVAVVVDDTAYAEIRDERLKVCHAIGHRLMGNVCVRCLDRIG